MSSIPAFTSRSDCPLPYVPDIQPSLIQDCEIPPIPDPFFETPILPPFIPPITLGCPPISVSASVSMVRDPSRSPSFSASASTYDPDGDNCFPTIDLDLWIPFACPILRYSPSPSVSKKFSVATQPSYSMTINSVVDSAPDCKFDFDLDITFVCTDVSMSTWVSLISADQSPSFSHSHSLKMSDGCCDLNVDIGLFLPDTNLVGSTVWSGSGDCISDINLSYYGRGSFVLEIERMSCSCTYC